ncbi:DUF1877 family protein [Actinoplanes regularis]|uniref:DUF1877 family protein n=1 Tax=Actinoplanes regularis TaxID=52697 RepID=A0A238YS33_9ACTN|nr:DUF1877 family protein [Actinoplanes regularis]GIE85509.1 hypothetical protein Are01nite_19890 [Actinoplanes regularis]SNR73772.1 protein of unknown function [Actinoplanes regularis]
MSILGSLARVSPELLEQLRAPDAQPYAVLSDHETQIDLDRYWDVLRFLLDAGGVPINPMRSGRLYPSVERAWGGPDGDSCLLAVEEARQVSEFLDARPFSDLAIHLRAAGEAPLYGNKQWDRPDIRDRVELLYEEMVQLFRDAADAGECTVFWAA